MHCKWTFKIFLHFSLVQFECLLSYSPLKEACKLQVVGWIVNEPIIKVLIFELNILYRHVAINGLRDTVPLWALLVLNQMLPERACN